MTDSRPAPLHSTYKHGHCVGGRDSRTYKSWRQMIARCCDPKHEQYSRYGGRGIKICDRWFSFEAFLADMGERPARLTLDRKDTNGNYEPENCRWATQYQQQRNRSNNKLTLDRARAIVMHVRAGASRQAAADAAGVSRALVRKILAREVWPEAADVSA